MFKGIIRYDVLCHLKKKDKDHVLHIVSVSFGGMDYSYPDVRKTSDPTPRDSSSGLIHVHIPSFPSILRKYSEDFPLSLSVLRPTE